MSGIKISLKPSNKVKKKSSNNKNKKSKAFGIEQADAYHTDIRITELKHHEEGKNDCKPLVITPNTPLRSILPDLQDKTDNFRTDSSGSAETLTQAVTKHEHTDIPDSTNPAEYDEVPVEGFGAALLRGMGWDPAKEKDGSSKRAVPPHKIGRPELLGIGAKAVASKTARNENFMPVIRVPKTSKR